MHDASSSLLAKQRLNKGLSMQGNKAEAGALVWQPSRIYMRPLLQPAAAE